MTFKAVRPMLLADDLQATMAFYVDVLGFQVLGTMEDPPEWCALGRDDIELMFVWYPPHDHAPGEEHDHPGPSLTGVLYVDVENIDALFASVSSKTERFEPLVDQPYGMREFDVIDPNGYRLRFGMRV